MSLRFFFALLAITAFGSLDAHAGEAPPLKVLFLGDRGHHQPAERYRQIEPVLARRGIEAFYTDRLESLSAKTLAKYDALVVYANHPNIGPDQEKALLQFVENGKGLVALHCASFCFQNSPPYVALVGAQFQKHGTGTFRTVSAAPDHPIMKDYQPFESWDETYVHTKHNEMDRTVLEVRTEGKENEPWTWVRTQGKGRVFYTAWGHDERTWGQPGFQQLVERGIRWTTGQDPSGVPLPVAESSPFTRTFPVPAMTSKRFDVKPFEYDEVGNKIPNYAPNRRDGKAEPMGKMQRPLPADESVKHFVLPKGFRAETFVTEKELGGKPICMTWDERGRLWAALTVDYPNELKPRGKGRDKIVCCEDTNGDGKADKVTVFATELSIPTSILCARGGLIVFDGTRTVFLKDGDGDGKAEVREVLFEGWGLGDTHAGPSNMQYGLDNWVWGMQGYDDSRLTVGGEQHRFRQGFFRFKPDATKMEFIRSTNNNTWGLGFSEEGIVFGSTANGNPSVYMPIPNRYYEAVRGWTPSLVLNGIAGNPRFHPVTDKVRQVDFHGGFTAAAGHALYTARAYPQEYWNRTAFVCEPTGHLVSTFVLSREGSGFRSTNPVNLAASDDEWSAPVMAEIGPDGNVWILDWYNFIVQHNPTPSGFKTGQGAAYETDLRDKKHGRIYRIVYEGADKPKTTAVSTLANATPEQLVAALKSDNMFWRRHAQRLLVERGDRDVLPALYELVRDASVDSIGLNTAAIHALWTIHGLGALDGKDPTVTEVAVAALRHPSAGVRRNAVQVLPRSPEATSAILDARLTDDSDPQVRLMALLALADQPASPATSPPLVKVLARAGGDRWLDDACIAASAKNAESVLGSLSSVEQPSPQFLAAIGIVAEHYARGGPTETVGVVTTKLVEADPAVIEVVIRGFSKGWPAKTVPKINAAFETALARLAERLPPDRRGVLVGLAVSWQSRALEKLGAKTAEAVLVKMKNSSVTTADRVAAASELLGYKPADQDAVKAILELITPQATPDLAAGLVRALRRSEVPQAADLILDRLPSFTSETRAAALAVLLTRPEWTSKLIAALDTGKVQVSDLALDQKQALAQHPDQSIREAAQAVLKRGGALPNADRQKVIEEYAAAIKNKGDLLAGKKLFTNECAKCHKHAGEGKDIGPDLTGMVVHPREELLIHILDPSRSVEGNFRVYQVLKADGGVVQGMLAAESKTAVELVDAEGKRSVILRTDIEKLVGSNKSLMPEGFEKQLTVTAMTDLLEFLTHKGKFTPLPLDKVATAVSTRGMFYDEAAEGERLDLGNWKPRTIEGVPFFLTDPKGDKAPNVILMYGPQGKLPPKMPKEVSLPCNTPVRVVHLLSGVGGWAHPYNNAKSVSLIVRFHYAGGKTEDHELLNGVHFADYINRAEVPGSKFAIRANGGQQVRYLAVYPKAKDVIERIEFVKGKDATAPVVMAVTLELPE